MASSTENETSIIVDQQVSNNPQLSVSTSLPPSPTARPCLFFNNGSCRNGDQCRFSHVPTSSRNASPVNSISTPDALAPPPFIITIPPGHPVYSIDVECVATSVQHNARSIAQVALVDEWSRPVFSVYIKQDMPVTSYITELTGLTKEILEAHGLPQGMPMF
jgi:hypothetical protein